MSMDLNTVKRIVDLWRTIRRDKIIIIGGPIASDLELLHKIDADISVRGEGEMKIGLILNSLRLNNLYLKNESFKTIGGITYRFSDKIYTTNDLPPISQI